MGQEIKNIHMLIYRSHNKIANRVCQEKWEQPIDVHCRLTQRLRRKKQKNILRAFMSEKEKQKISGATAQNKVERWESV